VKKKEKRSIAGQRNRVSYPNSRLIANMVIETRFLGFSAYEPIYSDRLKTGDPLGDRRIFPSLSVDSRLRGNDRLASTPRKSQNCYIAAFYLFNFRSWQNLPKSSFFNWMLDSTSI
jgi:hypothetical protein